MSLQTGVFTNLTPGKQNPPYHDMSGAIGAGYL